MQVDEEVAALIFFLFEVVAAFQSQTSLVFGFKVYAADSLSFNDCIFGAHVDQLVEVPRRTDKDISHIFHVRGKEIHANVYYMLDCQFKSCYYIDLSTVFDMLTINNCAKHKEQEITHFCLAQECKEDLLLCEECNKTPHKHSKTDIRLISEIKTKLKEAWEPKDSTIDPYFTRVKKFYGDLRIQIKDLIDEDQRKVQKFLTKVKYHHLPLEANSQAYLQLIKDQYDRLDKTSILSLLNEAESGQLSKQLDKQKEISNFLDIELKKIHEKVLTLQYVLLSKKFKNELLVPNLSEPSKVASHQEFVKIYSFFNSRDLLIRSAKLIYRASEYDFSPKSFYNRCNGVSNCMAIIKTNNNKLAGGFSPLPLVYHDEDHLTEKGLFVQDKTKRSFIFNISHLKSYSLKDSRKALLYKKDWLGPSFGQDLDIGQVVTSSVGHSYECEPNISIDSLEAKVTFLETQKAEVKELEIWQLSF